MTKSWLPPLALLVVLTSLPWSTGCSGDDTAATPKSKEEIRKQYIDRADRMRKESSGRK